MKSFIILSFTLLVLACGCCTDRQARAHRVEWQRILSALQSLPLERLETAIRAFKRDRKPTDSTVSLRELVSDGYLRAEDVQDLTDRDVSVSLTADETTPDKVLIRIRWTGRTDIVLYADGGVEMEARP